MKKFKFFALAALFCAMSTNAFATVVTWANTTLRYTYDDADPTAGATIIGFVNGLSATEMATLTIPAEVTQNDDETAIKVTAIAADAFKDNTNIKKVIFSSENLKTINAAFSGCTALADVDFTAATGVTSIATGAFTKCPLKALDLSKTKITAVNNLLGTTITGSDDVVNASLLSVSLPATWETIAAAAFANCTKLATVNFGTATAATQAFKTGNNFAGCPLTSLDFTGTKVTTIPATLLYDGTVFKAADGNETLETVTLTKTFTALNAALQNCTALETVSGHVDGTTSAFKTLVNDEFSGCTSLATFNTKYVTSIGNNAFKDCAALTAVDLTNATTLGTYAFSASGLTSVTFAKDKIADIPEGAFYQCESLATVAWNKDDATLASIAAKAFAGTAITTITFPKGAAISTTAADKIAANAFAACEQLKTVYWDKDVTPTAKYINQKAFAFCSDVIFYTGVLQVAYWDGTTNVVDNVTFKDIKEAPGTVADKLTMTAYKNGSGKYYYKMKAAANIAIAKGTAKVYDAWVDPTDDGVLNMQAYRPVSGYYQIKNGEVCLIVSDTEEVEIAEGSGTTSSASNKMGYTSLFNATTAGLAMQMTAAATTRVNLLLDAPSDDYSIYGWVNSANGTGFQKITSGSSISKDVLYAYAKEPAGGRLIVKWYDEDGNLEGETTGIQSVEAQAAEAEGVSYNLAGQKVAAGYKGIIIKNGKKVILK